jgi:hypothetical protein
LRKATIATDGSSVMSFAPSSSAHSINAV